MAAPWRNGVAEFDLAAICRSPQRAYHGGAKGAAIAVAPWRSAIENGENGGFFRFIFIMSTSRPARNSDAPASTPVPVPAPASAGHVAGTASRPAAAVRATRIDPGWKYVTAVEEGNTNDTIYNFCGKITKGGITRAKEHLMIKPGNVAGCKMVPKDVIAELWEFYNQKKNRGRQSSTPASTEEQSVNVRELDLDSLGFGLSEEDAQGIDEIPNPTPMAAARGGASSMRGPMDLYMKRPETAIARNKKEKLRQQNIKEACNKEAVRRVHRYIARWFYQAGIPLNPVRLKSFQEMLWAVGSFGPNLPAPTYHALRVPLLNEELEYTKDLLKGHKEQWEKYGCSIMSDAWTDKRQRSIINFLVNSPAGTMFLKSIDASDYVKTGEKMFELLDGIVEEIGEQNVVQVVTDNGSNYVLAGKLLMEKRPNLFWTPCAAHCLDLMLEDIGKLPLIQKTIKSAISLVSFTYSHSSTLSMLRQFTNGKELVRHAVIRFATSFLSLERLYEEKEI
ncbi:uncharacterized protein LOC110271879 [Arachis ipaensis]|uniref:uncharacterized protein LOC110271879 n=1 Tax=Arachis ipaensis TaxID=130454 RepID=UPI000A2AFE1E|nr:uncharacterized protein LOC110271879 [Arachis ipaensis]